MGCFGSCGPLFLQHLLLQFFKRWKQRFEIRQNEARCLLKRLEGTDGGTVHIVGAGDGSRKIVRRKLHVGIVVEAMQIETLGRLPVALPTLGVSQLVGKVEVVRILGKQIGAERLQCLHVVGKLRILKQFLDGSKRLLVAEGQRLIELDHRPVIEVVLKQMNAFLKGVVQLLLGVVGAEAKGIEQRHGVPFLAKLPEFQTPQALRF